MQPTRHELTNIPAPITAAEQSRRLAEWAGAMPRLRATSVPLGVQITYRDESGQTKTNNAEGTLLIEQQDDPRAPAKVLLLGKAFDQPVFEAGRNNDKWWFLIRMDTKTAWVGDATRPITWPDAGGGRSESILRADLVPDLLGLSALPSVDTRAGSEQIPLVMRVNDFDGTNDLLVIQPKPYRGEDHLSREVIVDRFTGNITRVRIYNQEGVLMVRSDLENYQPVTFTGDQDKPANAPSFPRQVTVTYPAQHMTISLKFDRVTVPATIPPAAFATPNFEKEQLKVVPAD